jgi:organic hydroperoxide reductase OsmC/OhrA
MSFWVRTKAAEDQPNRSGNNGCGEGIDQEKFAAVAEEVKKTCPISKALAATNITLKATLVSAQAA